MYMNTSDLFSIFKPRVFSVGQRVDNKGSIVEGMTGKEHEWYYIASWNNLQLDTSHSEFGTYIRALVRIQLSARPLLMLFNSRLTISSWCFVVWFMGLFFCGNGDWISGLTAARQALSHQIAPSVLITNFCWRPWHLIAHVAKICIRRSGQSPSVLQPPRPLVFLHILA